MSTRAILERRALIGFSFLCGLAAFFFRDVSAGTHLDELINEYNRYLNSARFIGNVVVYERDEWDQLRETFTRIIRECRRRQ
jgi:nicotinamidase-related amidase